MPSPAPCTSPVPGTHRRRCCGPTARWSSCRSPRGRPWGWRRGHGCRSRWPFGVGDTLFAFTDGLIERRDEDIDSGLERLATAVPRLRAADLAAGVVDVVEAVRDDTYDDDMAALALRRVG